MATRTERAELILDVDQFERAAQSASQEIQDLGKWIKNTIIIAGTAKIAEKLGEGLGYLKEQFSEVIHTGKDFAELGKAVGMAAGEYQKFQFAQKNGLSIADASHILGDQVQAYNKSGEMFRTLSLKLEEDQQKFKGLFVGFLSETSPALIALLDALGHVDYEGVGEKIGRPIREAASFLTGLIANKTIWELPGLLLAQGIAIAYNYWINLAENIDRALKSTADAVPKILKAGFDGVIKPVAMDLAAALADAVLTGLPYLQAGLQFAWQETRNGLVDAFRYAIAFFEAGLKTAIQRAVMAIAENLPGMKTILGITGNDLNPDSFKDQFQGALNKLNLDGLKTETKGFGDMLAESQQKLEGLKQRVAEALKNEGVDPSKAKEAGQAWLDALKKGADFHPTDFLGADKFGARIKQVIADATAKGKELTEQAEKNPYKNNFGMPGVFGETSSMTAVGGGGGVATGLLGVLDEARAQTNLQRQMVDLIAGHGGLSTGSIQFSKDIKFAY